MELANLERVKDLLSSLSKAQREYKTYPAKHPLLVKRREELFSKFEFVLSRSPEIPLRVEQDALFYGDKPVYQNNDRRESIAFNLHRNGVRELRFAKGVTRDELDSFILALNEELATDDADEDLVTLLWTRDLPHVTYDAIEDVDPRLDWVRDPAGALRTYLVSQRELPGTEKFAAAIKFEGGKPPRDARGEINAITLTPDEAATVRRLIAEDDARDLVLQVNEILVEVLRASADPTQVRNLLQILQAVVEISVEERQFKRAAATLRTLAELAPKMPQLENALRATIAHFAEPKLVKTLVDVVSKPAEAGLVPVDELDLFHYLTMLTKAAVVPLAEAMGVIEDRKMRKVFCESLAELVKTEPTLLATLSRDNRWFVARNVAYVLGLTKNPEALRILRSLATHANEKVRAETVRAAAPMGMGARDIVHHALTDPDRSVRILAFEVILPFRDDTTPGLLLAQLGEKEFEPKDAAEKKALAIAAARVLGEHALAPLSVLLTKRRTFGGAATEADTRAASAAGIAAINSPPAVDYLRKGMSAGDAGLAAACEQALREAKLL
jgi:hypothetical protein